MARWKPGESGNRGGRPKGLGDVRDIARQHASRAIEVLPQIMDDPQAAPSARQAAAVALLDRGYGRPEQAIIAAHAPAPLTPEEMVTQIHVLEQRLGIDRPPLLMEATSVERIIPAQ